MTEAALVLQAKLLPPSPGPEHLSRPRLHQRLALGLEGRATVILAGPGYGKTSLVARFLQERPAEAVWYRLDAADNDPWLFLQYLVQGIREHVPEFGELSAGLWESLRPQTAEVERLVDVFIRDAEESLGGRLLIVFDGVEALEQSPLCARALKRLLAYLPGTLHLMLVGRSLAGMSVKTLLAEGPVNEIHGEELLFTLDEIRTLLLETFRLPLQPADIHQVQERTRGWVTALQLLRQTARLAPGAELPASVFEKTESEIFDYFSEQVLASAADEVREFLLATSLLPVIDPELVQEVLKESDARGILEGLLRQRLFISALESRGELYAYDPLFRDFLIKKLRTSRGVPYVRRLQRRYGQAFAARRDFSNALVHLRAAGEVKLTADLLARHGKSLLEEGLLEPVRSAALFLLENQVRSALVEDLLGEACRRAGDYTAAVRHFEVALAAEGAGGRAALFGTARASALQGLAYSQLKLGETAQAERTAEQALAEAGQEHPALVARILNTLSIARYRDDRHAEAIAGWQEALARARQAGDEHLTLMIAHNLGLPHAVMGDLRRASECFQILTSPANPRIGPEEGAARLNLARIAILRGEFGAAAPLLDDAWEIAQKWNLQALAADVLEAQANLLRETGELAAAGEKYARARALLTELGLLDLLDSLAEEEALLSARRGEYEQGERIATAILTRARAAGQRERVASALLALGEVYARSPEPRGAIAALEESATLFERLGRAYQECMARLWLSLARHRSGEADAARTAGAQALGIVSSFDFGRAVERVLELSPALRGALATLPGAPAFLRQPPPAAARDTPIPLGPVSPTGADLTVRLLGPVEVYRDAERKVPASAWKLKRALKIFCYLAASRNHRATKERIVDVIWEDARLSVIEKNFHPTISFLRRALNHGHPVPKNFILYEAGAYLFNPAYRYDIDSESFEKKIRQARAAAARGDAASALSELGEALALYRGPFLEEEYDSWVEAPLAHFEALYTTALKEAGELHLHRGDPELGIGHLRRLVERSPVDEEASVRLMTALGGLGQRGAVEREYQRLEQALDAQLSAAPEVETRRAYRQALTALSSGT